LQNFIFEKCQMSNLIFFEILNFRLEKMPIFQNFKFQM
jgi:hypothetical protein